MTTNRGGEPTVTKPVEVSIRASVYKAAAARARTQHVDLAAVAKQIVRQAAEGATPVEGARTYPLTIERGVQRKRLRMTVGPEWDRDRDAIRASGASVANTIERGLDHYSSTGVVAAPLPNPDRRNPK
jgi:hypothetical protein